jgi:ankyrin repeat protein
LQDFANQNVHNKTRLEDVLKLCEETAAWYGISIADIHQRNPMGDTPLHTICSWGKLEPVEVLVAAGANVNALGDQGCTPLFNAVIGGNEKVIEFLIRNGANVEIKGLGNRSVFEYASNISASKKVISALKTRRM